MGRPHSRRRRPACRRCNLESRLPIDADLAAERAADLSAYPDSGWRRPRGEPSLSETFRSLPTAAAGAAFWRRALAWAGPGYLVAVGYMDPGNWATDLAGGSAFGYLLLSVVLASSVAAMVLQGLAARLGIGAGRDLAQACRDAFPAWINLPLWALCELAIVACDLAEVIGTAVALQLLFHLPLLIGVVLTGLDVFLLLALQRFGMRVLEALIVSLITLIGAAFLVEVLLSRPDWAGVSGGLVPSPRILRDPAVLYLAIGIVGATVMPHNLYLHSSLVQSRRFPLTPSGRREALGFATLDSTIALTLAFLVNAAILVVAAAAFHTSGHTQVAEIQDAHRLLAPLLGAPVAALLFALALLAAGQNSTITATLAGQVVMEGFLDLKLKPWLRRMLTRAVAIVPAVAVTAVWGEGAVARLLVLSQVVLSLQLPFALVPLLMFTGSRSRLGAMASPRWLSALGWVITAVITAGDGLLLMQLAHGGST